MSNAALDTLTFDSAKREFDDAWGNPSHTRFELPAVNVNKTLKDRYRATPDKRVTRAMIWDMETKKAWDPLTYIPYVVSKARSWERHELPDSSVRFNRSSVQRGWVTDERGLVLEDVYVSNAKQSIFFLGRSRMVEENGNVLETNKFQPLFFVEHGVGGAEDEPLNLWRIVHLTPQRDRRYEEPFEQMVRAGLLPGFIEIYIEKDLGVRLTRR